MSFDGEYITDRLFPGFIEQACVQLGIQYQAFSDGWVHRLTRDELQKWVIGYSFDINSTAASGLARDKVATYQALDAHSIPAVEHFLARSRAVKNVLTDNLCSIPAEKPVVIKPLEGASGHGVRLFATKAAASIYLAKQPHTDWAMSPWYDVTSETRLTLLDGDVICAYEKQEPSTRDGLVLYNLGTGATAAEITPTNELTAIAQSAQRACSLRLCAIDIVRLRDDSLIVLEVNEGIMMEHFANQSAEYRRRAEEVYRLIIERMFS